MKLIDIGVNFNSQQIAIRHDAIIQRAIAAGVARMLATGTSVAGSQAMYLLANAFAKNLWSTAGVHPNDPSLIDFTDKGLISLMDLWAKPKVVAIGECGLDYCRKTNAPAKQRAVFSAQLNAGAAFNKPVFLHCRDAFDDFKPMIADYMQDGGTGVVHCFTGDTKQALAFLELGLDLGITGWVADEKRGQGLRDALKHIPLDRIHLETDAPYLSIKSIPNRKDYNEPANLPHVAKAVATLKELPVEEVAAASVANTLRLFKLPKP